VGDKLRALAQGLGWRGLPFSLVLCSLLVLSATAAETPAELDLDRADWSVNAPHDLAHNPPSEGAVRSFLRYMANSVGGITNQVCDVQFADLKHNGTLSLVLGDDGGGTADCNYSEIFDKNAGRFEEYFLDAYIGSPGVEDINGDGRFEVIVDGLAGRENVGEYYGKGTSPYCNMCVTCTEYWPRVLAWTGSAYADVSSQYPKYYERELLSLKKQIATINAAQAVQRAPAAAPSPMRSETRLQGFAMAIPEGHELGSKQSPEIVPQQIAMPTPTPEAAEPPDANDLDCLKAEAAKIERFLGISKEAGMNDAIGWANSHDPAQRDFTTEVLSDIGTAEALKYEQTLSRDSDPDVAKSAKSELESWGQAETPNTFDLVSTVQIKPKATDPGAK
jgi:hypothetical protein